MVNGFTCRQGIFYFNHASAFNTRNTNVNKYCWNQNKMCPSETNLKINLAKSLSSVTSTSVALSFWNLAQNTAALLPRQVQSFLNDWATAELVISQIRFREFDLKTSFNGVPHNAIAPRVTNYKIDHDVITLTHWNQDKMAPNFLTPFSNTFFNENV